MACKVKCYAGIHPMEPMVASVRGSSMNCCFNGFSGSAESSLGEHLVLACHRELQRHAKDRICVIEQVLCQASVERLRSWRENTIVPHQISTEACV